MIPRFLIDENMTRKFRRKLEDLHPLLDIRFMGDEGAPALGTPDPDILIWIERNDYLLVTNNRISMPHHLREHLRHGGHVPGILCFSRPVPIHAIIENLALVWGAADTEEYHDSIEYLPL